MRLQSPSGGTAQTPGGTATGARQRPATAGWRCLPSWQRFAGSQT